MLKVAGGRWCTGGLQNFYENYSWIDYFDSYKGDLFWIGCFKALSINKWFEVSDWSKLFVSALNLMGNKIDTKKKPK